MVSRGKSKRRRESNVRAAKEKDSNHGMSSLAPPPSNKDITALPANLRRIMAFKQAAQEKSAAQNGHAATSGGDRPIRGGHVAGKAWKGAFGTQRTVGANQKAPAHQSQPTPALKNAGSGPQKDEIGGRGRLQGGRFEARLDPLEGGSAREGLSGEELVGRESQLEEAKPGPVQSGERVGEGSLSERPVSDNDKSEEANKESAEGLPLLEDPDVDADPDADARRDSDERKAQSLEPPTARGALRPREENVDSPGGGAESELAEGKEKKRRRKEQKVGDWRVAAAYQMGLEGRKQKGKLNEKKRKYLESKKLKKRKKGADGLDQSPWDQAPAVRFGEVVSAPPKLSSKPKSRGNAKESDKVGPGAKTTIAHHWPETMGDRAASKERLRQAAVEGYRNRRGWASRPGAPKLPTSLRELT